MVRLTFEGKTFEVTEQEFEQLFELQYRANNKFLPKQDRKIAKAHYLALLQTIKKSKEYIVDENEI